MIAFLILMVLITMTMTAWLRSEAPTPVRKHRAERRTQWRLPKL